MSSSNAENAVVLSDTSPGSASKVATEPYSKTKLMAEIIRRVLETPQYKEARKAQMEAAEEGREPMPDYQGIIDDYSEVKPEESAQFYKLVSDEEIIDNFTYQEQAVRLSPDEKRAGLTAEEKAVAVAWSFVVKTAEDMVPEINRETSPRYLDMQDALINELLKIAPLVRTKNEVVSNQSDFFAKVMRPINSKVSYIYAQKINAFSGRSNSTSTAIAREKQVDLANQELGIGVSASNKFAGILSKYLSGGVISDDERSTLKQQISELTNRIAPAIVPNADGKEEKRYRVSDYTWDNAQILLSSLHAAAENVNPSERIAYRRDASGNEISEPAKDIVERSIKFLEVMKYSRLTYFANASGVISLAMANAQLTALGGRDPNERNRLADDNMPTYTAADKRDHWSVGLTSYLKAQKTPNANLPNERKKASLLLMADLDVYAELMTERDELVKELNAAEADLRLTPKQIRDLKAEHSSRRNTIGSRSLRITLLPDEIEALEDRLEAHKNSLGDEGLAGLPDDDARARFTDRVEELETQINDKREELAELKSQNKNRKKDLKALERDEDDLARYLKQTGTDKDLKKFLAEKTSHLQARIDKLDAKILKTLVKSHKTNSREAIYHKRVIYGSSNEESTQFQLAPEQLKDPNAVAAAFHKAVILADTHGDMIALDTGGGVVINADEVDKILGKGGNAGPKSEVPALNTAAAALYSSTNAYMHSAHSGFIYPEKDAYNPSSAFNKVRYVITRTRDYTVSTAMTFGPTIGALALYTVNPVLATVVTISTGYAALKAHKDRNPLIHLIGDEKPTKEPGPLTKIWAKGYVEPCRLWINPLPAKDPYINKQPKKAQIKSTWKKTVIGLSLGAAAIGLAVLAPFKGWLDAPTILAGVTTTASLGLAAADIQKKRFVSAGVTVLGAASGFLALGPAMGVSRWAGNLVGLIPSQVVRDGGLVKTPLRAAGWVGAALGVHMAMGTATLRSTNPETVVQSNVKFVRLASKWVEKKISNLPEMIKGLGTSSRSQNGESQNKGVNLDDAASTQKTDSNKKGADLDSAGGKKGVDLDSAGEKKGVDLDSAGEKKTKPRSTPQPANKKEKQSASPTPIPGDGKVMNDTPGDKKWEERIDGKGKPVYVYTRTPWIEVGTSTRREINKQQLEASATKQVV